MENATRFSDRSRRPLRRRGRLPRLVIWLALLLALAVAALGAAITWTPSTRVSGVSNGA